MRKGWGLFGILCAWGVALAQPETRVYSVFAPPGDWFTHSGANYAFFPFFHQWNWYYGHVQRDGVVGIRTDYPRSGNGSVYFYAPTTLAKSDIEFRFLDGQSYWGRLRDLEWLSYEWYRDGRSTVGAHIHLPLRIYVGNLDAQGRIRDLGYLIYERSMNGGGAVPVDTWVMDEVAASNQRFWQNPINGGNFFDAQPLSVWQSDAGYQPREGSRVGVRYNGDSVVCGVSVGAGTGWSGAFIGAMDNIILRFRGGVLMRFNFEVRPEGDVNGDGIVDDADLLQILMLFGNTCSGYCPYDLNRDGVVDDADLLIVLMNFGAGGG
ncbi:MAG: hypothetical protein N2554_05380 [Fimbriimonadales bacterium]|nr:hypothetical protein [Fimbriimonadales bacterium]